MLWRISPGRSRRTPPAGFILPAQPTQVAKPPSGPDWIHEVKHDGYRLLASKTADRVVLWTRHGTDFTDRLPAIAEAVRALPVDDVLIDGEAVAFRPDGHRLCRPENQPRRSASVIRRLRSSASRRRGSAKLPLEVRRAELEALLAGQDAIQFSESLDAPGALVFEKACEMGLEGIVSKRLGGTYWSGKCRNWLKVKNPAFQRSP
jgi:bifunctional non-homologous end joining protein LigD